MERHGVSGVMVCKVPVKSSGGLMWDGLRWCCLVLSVCIILDVVDGMKVKPDVRMDFVVKRRSSCVVICVMARCIQIL